MGERTVIEGIDTLGEVAAPVFQVYVGTPPARAASKADELLESATAATDVRAAVDVLIANGSLVPLAGPVGPDRTQQTNDVVSVQLEESIEGNFPLTTVRVSLLNVYDPRAQRYRYTDARTSGKDRSPLIDYGKTLVLRMGYPVGGKLDQVVTVFEGIVVSFDAGFPADGPPTLDVVATDRRDQLRSVRLERGDSFRAGSVEELIAKVAAVQGLRVAVTREQLDRLGGRGARTSLDARFHVPADQDLLQFVTARAKQAALELTAFGNVLFVEEPNDGSARAIRYAYRRGLISFDPSFNSSGRPTKVVVKARNPDTGSRVRGEATLDGLREKGLTFPEDRVNLDLVRDRGQAGERPLVVTNYAASTRTEANLIAQAALKRHLDQAFTASGELLGDPRIRVRTNLEVGGAGRYDGPYYLTMTRHKFGDNGYQTSFRARRNKALPDAASEPTS